MKEIERKFLIGDLRSVTLGQGQRLSQGYLAIAPAGVEVRLRKEGTKAQLTVKRGKGIERPEINVELLPEQFRSLWPATKGCRIWKTRYRVGLGDGHTAQVDVYGGVLNGYASVEVEFPTRREARRFVPPPWFGKEVTDDDRYKNQNLASLGVPRSRRIMQKMR